LIEREFSGDGDLETALALVRESEAIPRTRELAKTFAREAKESLDWLPESPSKAALLELPDFVLSRLY
jgi:all-trans-nonaprenyl-diphosphate synthase